MQRWKVHIGSGLARDSSFVYDPPLYGFNFTNYVVALTPTSARELSGQREPPSPAMVVDPVTLDGDSN